MENRMFDDLFEHNSELDLDAEKKAKVEKLLQDAKDAVLEGREPTNTEEWVQVLGHIGLSMKRGMVLTGLLSLGMLVESIQKALSPLEILALAATIEERQEQIRTVQRLSN